MCTSIGYLHLGVHSFFFFNLYTHFYCLVGCLSMIVWTHAVLSILYACVLYFCVCTCSVQLSMFHMERCCRNTLIILNVFNKGVLCHVELV